MAVEFSQSTVGRISTAANAAIPSISVTISSGDIVIILEAIGRLTTHSPTWLVDSNQVSPLKFFEADENTVYAYAVNGLSAGSHSIDSVNGSGSGWGATRGRIYGVVVVTGAEMIGSGDVAMYISASSNSSTTWTATDIPAEGGALMLGASRTDNGVASVSHTLLGSADSDGGGTASYSSGALLCYTTVSANASENLTTTFNSPGGRAYAGVVFSPAPVGEAVNQLRVGGVAPGKLYYGSTAVNRVYKGASRVYGSTPDG